MHKKHTSGCSRIDVTLVLGFIPDRVGTLHTTHTSGCCENDVELVLGLVPDRIELVFKIDLKFVLGLY